LNDEESKIMSMNRLSLRWVRLALMYYALAVLLGYAMSASHDHRLKGVHVHLNMLGWMSMSLFAWLYSQFPQAARSKAAAVHFWLYNLGLPVMMAGLAGLLLGHAQAEPVVALGATVTVVAVLTFVVNMLLATRQRTPVPAASRLQSAAA
jgi:cbb3-type cytochrome oxidase subunit 1